MDRETIAVLIPFLGSCMAALGAIIAALIGIMPSPNKNRENIMHKMDATACCYGRVILCIWHYFNNLVLLFTR